MIFNNACTNALLGHPWSLNFGFLSVVVISHSSSLKVRTMFGYSVVVMSDFEIDREWSEETFFLAYSLSWEDS